MKNNISLGDASYDKLLKDIREIIREEIKLIGNEEAKDRDQKKSFRITPTEPQVEDTGRYSVTETAKALNIDRHTLHNHINDGFIHFEVRKSNGRKFFFGHEIKRYWRAKY